MFGLADHPGAARHWQIAMKAGKCYYASAVGDDTVEELALSLRASKDEIVRPRNPGGKNAILAFCPPSDGTFTVQAEARRGAGHMAVGIFEREANAEDEKSNVLVDAVDAHARRVAREFARMGPAFRSTSLHVEWAVDLSENHCYWFIGEGSGKVTGLGLRLLDSKGREVAAAAPESNSVAIKYCNGPKASYRLKAYSPSGSGEYFVGVFAGKSQ